VNVAVIGAGVSGLTTAIVLAERGDDVTLYDAPRAHMASPAAGAIWFLYDLEGDIQMAEAWAFRTFDRLVELVDSLNSGVSMMEFRVFGMPEIPEWTHRCDFRTIDGGFAVTVPLMDTPVYLQYLRSRFRGTVREVPPLASLDDVPLAHDIIVNCSGFGARALVSDARMQPHRGQVVLTERQPSLSYAFVNEDAFTYVIPRSGDCVLGGTNDVSSDVLPSEATTSDIRRRCTPIVPESVPSLGVRVGLRPFREGGVRLVWDRTADGRRVIHNYGHGGSGFTVSWGCAEAVARLLP
jgi:D-amino-acid oxidase